MLFLGCTSKTNQTAESITAQGGTEMQNISSEVGITPCIKNVFVKKTLLTGVIMARESAMLKSDVGGIINSLYGTNGKRVSKGDVLLILDDKEEQFAIEQVRTKLSDAIIKKSQMLIDYGGSADDDLSVKPYQLKVIYAITGYHKIVQDIKELEYRLSKKKIKAPFPGLIADLKVKQYEIIQPGQELCTMINPSTYEVTFMAMENQSLRLQKGQKVITHPLTVPNETYTAYISMVNPKVNKDGLVEVRASLQGKFQHLYENMNMRVVIEEPTKSYILVPKSALVRRSERTVVFTYEASTKTAKWNYVTLVDENDTHYAISDGLAAGQLVIHEGNLNLDHGATVTLKK